MTFRVVQGPYFQDLMAQPRALAATLDALAGQGLWQRCSELIRSRAWKRIVLTGMGSSFYSLQILHLALIHAGMNSLLMETSELLHYGLRARDEQTLTIVVSQSGASAEILRLLTAAGPACTLAVTNTEDSRLANTANMALLLRAGPEHSVSCKTYVATLLVLQWLAAMVRGEPEAQTLEKLASAPGMVRAFLDNWDAYTQMLAPVVRDTRHLFLTGRGSSMAAVGTGALVLKEAARIHAEGMSSAAFRHGPIEMMRRDILTLVFTGDDPTRELNSRLVCDLLASRQRCEAIGPDAETPAFRVERCDSLVRPILEILPVQMLTLAVPALTGLESGRFERASKITAVE